VVLGRLSANSGRSPIITYNKLNMAIYSCSGIRPRISRTIKTFSILYRDFSDKRGIVQILCILVNRRITWRDAAGGYVHEYFLPTGMKSLRSDSDVQVLIR
jgi:hypothetical protein